MRKSIFVTAVIATGVLHMSLQSSVLHATTEGPGISVDSAIHVSQSVVAGRFTGNSDTQLWVYEDALNDRGQVEPQTEVMTAYEFSISETLDGEQLSGTVRINIPGGRHNQHETPQRQKVPAPGVDVVIGVNTDRAATRRGLSGYNLVHGKVLPVTEAAPLEEIKAKVMKIRQPSPALDAYEMQTEMMENSLTGVNFDNEYVSTEQSYTGDVPPSNSPTAVLAQQQATGNDSSRRGIHSPPDDDKVTTSTASSVTEQTVTEQSFKAQSVSMNHGPPSSSILRLFLFIALLVVIATAWVRHQNATQASV